MRTTTTTDDKGKIEIAMSDRAPVRISPEDWPVIAKATWFSGDHECQANEQAWLKVRRHRDGRVLVYGDRDRGPGGMPIQYRGTRAGFLLPTPATTSAEIARTIRRVVGVLGHDLDCLAEEAIADLPAEDL